MNRPESWRPRRIVIAARISTPAAEGLEIATWIAAPGTVEMEAILVEDDVLASVASLPFTREVHRSSGTVLGFDPERAARLHRLGRSRLTESMRRLNRALRPRVVRGNLGRAATEAGAAADVVVVSPAMRGVGAPHRRPREGSARERSIAVLYPGEAAGDRALALAARIAAERGVALHVLLTGSQAGLPAASWAEATSALDSVVPVPHLHRVSGESLPVLGSRLRRDRAGLLVIGHTPGRPPREELVGADELPCPVVLVRS